MKKPLSLEEYERVMRGILERRKKKERREKRKKKDRKPGPNKSWKN